jgi:hypothetical protein
MASAKTADGSAEPFNRPSAASSAVTANVESP